MGLISAGLTAIGVVLGFVFLFVAIGFVRYSRRAERPAATASATKSEGSPERLITWVEPFGADGAQVQCQAAESAVIARQHAIARLHGIEYPNDQVALDAFTEAHWAQKGPRHG